MSYNKKDKYYNVDFDNFWPDLCQKIQAALEQFWECEVEFKLLAINDFESLKDEEILKNQDFLSTQITVEKHKPVIIRLDFDFVKNFLNSTLDDSEENFELTNLTDLEIKILNKFCEFLYKNFCDILTPTKNLKITPKSEKNYNIVFATGKKDEFLSKIVISIPQDRIELKDIEKIAAFRDEDFLNSASHVKIRAGYTKLTLEELRSLNSEDIVVLDNSKSSYLTLISGELEQKFRVEINDSLILNIKTDDESDEIQQQTNNNEVNMNKNLWDDIQIELSAEFSKVKMTIGELKQITKGQIVDLGSVFENEISLYVEDKKVAKGELIIINDKYAVKLNEVLNSNTIAPAQKTDTKISETKDTTPKQAPQGAPQDVQKPAPKAPQGAKPLPPKAPQGAQTPPQGAAQNPKAQRPLPPPQKAPTEDEEFDYSDFEN